VADRFKISIIYIDNKRFQSANFNSENNSQPHTLAFTYRTVTQDNFGKVVYLSLCKEQKSHAIFTFLIEEGGTFTFSPTVKKDNVGRPIYCLS